MDTPKILVIGYGNSLAGDDALGFYAVQKLVGSELPANVAVKYIHQLMPEHAEEISEYDVLIFIDAEDPEGNNTDSGIFNCRKIKFEELHDRASSAHEYTLDSILLISLELYKKIPEVYLLTVTGKSFLTSDRLTPVVEERLPEVVDMVYMIINKKIHFPAMPVIM